MDGLWGGADDLAAQGIDVRPVLNRLDKADLILRLKTDAEVSKVPALDGGRQIHNTFLLVEDLLDQGLLLALTTGTGTKFDEDLHVPAVDWLAKAVVLTHHPAVTFAREWSRWGRDEWALGPLVTDTGNACSRRAEDLGGHMEALLLKPEECRRSRNSPDVRD